MGHSPRWPLFVLLVGLLAGLSGHSNADPLERSLDGRWQFRVAELSALDGYRDAVDTSRWRHITVPANWYRDGVDHTGMAWYRRTFKARNRAEDIYVLRFDGVDYAANVWLNEQHVGFHEGYFSPFELDVTAAMANRQRHTLAVLVDSPSELPGPSWSLRKRLIKGVLSHHDTRPGGAWSQRGQEANTGGIWESVKLRRASGVYLATPTIKPELDFAAGRTRAHVRVQGAAPHWRGLSRAQLTLVIEPVDGDTPAQRFDLGQVTPTSKGYRTRVEIKEPQLWWPRGRGAAALYRATVIATDSDGAERHRTSTTFGLREVMRQESGHWQVNGKRFFLKGTNYIASQWKSEMSRADYVRDIELMLDANVNIVRVHAQVEAKRFYEEADRQGLLVWQDFPLQWGYEETDVLRSAAETQLIEMLRALNNHPSVVVWSLHNEPPWDADWMKWKYQDYDPKQNLRLDRHLYRIAQREDQSRYVHMVSQTAEHPWFGWYSGSIDTFGKATTQSLITEYGAQALPDKASLRRIFDRRDPFPRSDDDWALWAYHNFQRKETFEIAKLPKPADLDDFIATTQGYQADLIRFAVAAYRRQMYEPVGGIFQFMFVEDWPSVNWGIVDYYRKPKPGYYALRDSYAPVLAFAAPRKRQFKPGQVSIPIWLSNDRWQTDPEVLVRARLQAGNSVLSERQFVAAAPADSSKRIAQLDFSLPPGSYALQLQTTAGEQPPVTHDLAFTVTPND